MKKSILKSLAGALMIAGLFSTTLTSCSDPCKDVVCENAGTCNEGICECAEGYEGSSCETEIRAQFIGSYTGAGTVVCDSTGSGSVTDLSIAISNSSSNILGVIVNLEGNNLTATVDGSNLTFASQVVNGYTYTGTGSISGTTISMTLNEYDPSYPETCVYTLTATKL